MRELLCQRKHGQPGGKMSCPKKFAAQNLLVCQPLPLTKALNAFFLLILKIHTCPYVAKVVKMSSRWNTCPPKSKKIAFKRHVGGFKNLLHTFKLVRPELIELTFSLRAMKK